MPSTSRLTPTHPECAPWYNTHRLNISKKTARDRNRSIMLTTLPFKVLLMFPFGYFLFSYFFPCHTAQFICINLMQSRQQVFDPLIANRTHCPDIDFGCHCDIMEDDPLKSSLLVIKLENTKISS